MRVIKVLNNSLVLTQTDQQSEVIVMGKGLGFQLRPDDEIPEEKIEKVYVLDSIPEETKSGYLQIFENSSEKLLLEVQNMIDHAKKELSTSLSDNLFFTLADHLNYAIERSKQQIVVQNKLLLEVQRYYPMEYQIGLAAVQEINQNLEVHLPIEEAGNIGFHLVNAQTKNNSMSETMQSIQMLKDISNLVKHSFPEKELDSRSFTYTRFLTHLQFFINRIITDEELPNQNMFLLESIEQNAPKEYRVAQKIKTYVEEELNKTVTQDEVIYLTLHLVRLT